MSSKIRGVHHCHLSPPSDIQEVASEQLFSMSLGSRVRRPWVQNLSAPLTSLYDQDKLLHLPVPQCPHLLSTCRIHLTGLFGRLRRQYSYRGWHRAWLTVSTRLGLAAVTVVK